MAAPASAHASLVGTDPAEGAVVPEAPAEVTFTFDEPVSVVDNGVAAYDASGAPLEVEAAAQDEVVTAGLPADLDDGTYVVVWRVVSSDGHPIAGSLTFHVGAPSEEVVPPETAAEGSGSMRSVASLVQAVSYVGLLLCVGLVVFLGWTLRGIRVRDTVRRRLVRVLRWAGAVAVVAAAVAVPVAGAYQRGVGLGGLLEGASYDPDLVSGRLIVLAHQAIGLGLACVLIGRPRDERTPPPSLADIGAAFAVWSPALVGHTRAYEPASLLVLTDALHLTAGAVWLGGLTGLAPHPAVAGGPGAGRRPAAQPLLDRGRRPAPRHGRRRRRAGVADPRLVERPGRHDVRTAAAGEGRPGAGRGGDRRLEPVPPAPAGRRRSARRAPGDGVRRPPHRRRGGAGDRRAARRHRLPRRAAAARGADHPAGRGGRRRGGRDRRRPPGAGAADRRGCPPHPAGAGPGRDGGARRPGRRPAGVGALGRRRGSRRRRPRPGAGPSRRGGHLRRRRDPADVRRVGGAGQPPRRGSSTTRSPP
nr:copper resistance protein CopC [Nocardioides sp. TF02-7]